MTLKQRTDVEEKQEAFLPANNSIYTDTATSVIQFNTCQPICWPGSIWSTNNYPQNLIYIIIIIVIMGKKYRNTKML